VQSYQAIGELEARDRERAAVLELWKRGAVPEPSFCREQLAVGERWLMVNEHFELTGEQARRYTFRVLSAPKGGEELFRLVLGSYTATDALMHEAGQLRVGERAFHLDAYHPDGRQRLIQLFDAGEPSYEVVRELVLKTLPER
jgi:hypothetical protein